MSVSPESRQIYLKLLSEPFNKRTTVCTIDTQIPEKVRGERQPLPPYSSELRHEIHNALVEGWHALTPTLYGCGVSLDADALS